MHLSLNRKNGPRIYAMWRYVARYCTDFITILTHWRNSGAQALRGSQQTSSRHVQVYQSASHEQPVGVLVQTPITNLVKAKHPLENQERMLNLGADARLYSILRTFSVRQGLVTAAFLLGKVLGLRRMLTDQLALSSIGRITPDTGFTTMQQIGKNHRGQVSHSNIVNIYLCHLNFIITS